MFTLRPSLKMAVAFAFCSALSAQNLSPTVLNQIGALLEEKGNRNPAQQKMDSHLIYADKLNDGQQIAQGVASAPWVTQGLQLDPASRVLVDLKANVNQGLLSEIRARGGTLVNSVPQNNTIRAWLPLNVLETLAGRADITAIHRATGRIVNADPGRAAFAARAANVRSQLSRALARKPKRGIMESLGLGFFTRPVSQGDAAHGANTARSTFSVNGTGIKVGVLSDSASAASIAALVATGDLPPGGVTVVPGQDGTAFSGFTDEGTAMLEIVYDLAPGAQLFFATADPTPGQFAANINTLRFVYGCDIIVDDVTYFNEGAFQDGTIAQAVNAVVASGALYFSSAANSGNADAGTSGTWEGDFVDSGFTATYIGGKGGTHPIHLFSGGGFTVDNDPLTAATKFVTLKWSDPLGGANNDYDLFILNSTGTTLLCASVDIQNGSQDPYESCSNSSPFPTGSLVLVVRFSGAARALRVDTHRGRLLINTSGSTFGHNAGANSVSMAATSAQFTFSLFTSAANVETYSSDGLRKIFYQPDGTPITPGNFLFGTNGGLTLHKPNLTAADCAASHVPGFNPFCGTSAAAPHAAAIAALVKSAKPSLTNAQILAALTNPALDIQLSGYDRDSGQGIIMATAAVQSVLLPPTMTKAFSPTQIPLGSTSTLTFTITNPNEIAISSVAFTDTLPAGLVVATPSGFSGSSCGGTVTATPGQNSVKLASGTLAAGGSCTFSVTIQSVAAGVKNNSTTPSANTGTGSAATAGLIVVAPPVIAKSFSGATVPINGTTTLTFTITDPNTAGVPNLTGIGFTDNLPGGLIVATPNGLTGSCGGGIISATAGSGTITLSGATLSSGASCTFSVNITATSRGLKTNTTTAVTSNEGGSGNSATATILVTAFAGVAVSSTGNTFVSDPRNNRVVVFGPSGNFLAAIKPLAPDPGLNQPAGVALIGSNVVVADSGNNRVVIMNTGGSVLATLNGSSSGTGLNAPLGVSVTSNNVIWIADAGNNRVIALTTSGGTVAQISASFNQPNGVAIVPANGNILVTDSGNNVVKSFQGTTPLSQFGSAGSGAGQFSDPSGIKTASNGDILVTDTDNNRVETFDFAGNYKTQFLGSFNTPSGVTVASNGNIVVVDQGNNLVKWFGPAGNFLFQAAF